MHGNEGILISTLTMQEAKDSSAIENITATHHELFRFRDIGSKKINHAAKEVENCRGNYWGRIPFYIPSIDHLFDRGTFHSRIPAGCSFLRSPIRNHCIGWNAPLGTYPSFQSLIVRSLIWRNP
ncbi:MAG: hypothetical protein OES26_22735 [Gammaproteobacteria bacterium]|nr:hypothetical protein [Gammaproteobacteria bacterium]